MKWGGRMKVEEGKCEKDERGRGKEEEVEEGEGGEERRKEKSKEYKAE